jgi:hypothetical protein
MRTNINLSLLVIFLFLMASCNRQECQMCTTINEDGSCTRSVEFHATSAQLASGKLDTLGNVFRTSCNWKLSWHVKGEKNMHPFPMDKKSYDSIQTATDGRISDTVVVCASNEWASVEEMGRQTCFNLDSTVTLKPRTELKRSFRWFYTYYSYREIYPQQKLYFKIPLLKFMSKDEIGYWFTGTPNLGQGLSGIELDDMMSGIKEKYSNWLTANYFESVYDLIVNNYQMVKKAPVNKQNFISLHDSLQRIFISKGFDILDAGSTNTALRKFFHSDAYSSLVNDDELTEKASKSSTIYMALLQFSVDYQLVMPGHILNSGNGIVSRSDVGQNHEIITYRLTGERLIPGDYVIAAESRVTNIWAFIVLGIIVLIALFCISYKARKKIC